MKLDLNEMRKAAGLPEQLVKVTEGLIAQADEFKVEHDENDQVHIIDGEGTIRVSMPVDVWRQLISSKPETSDVDRAEVETRANDAEQSPENLERIRRSNEKHMSRNDPRMG